MLCMKKLAHWLLAFWLLLMMPMLLTGCQTPPELKDGYQFGDISKIALRDIKKISHARDVYCADASTVILRKAAVITIRSYLPAYPENGICTRLDKVLTDTIAKKDRMTNIRDGP